MDPYKAPAAVEDAAPLRRGPPGPLRALFALLGFSSVHWAAGRWRRALVFDGLYLASLLLVFHGGAWIAPLLVLAQIIDAALLTPARVRSTVGYLIAVVIAFSVSLLVSTVIRGTWAEGFQIPSGSMVPTLLVGDRVRVDKTARHPGRGDVVAFVRRREGDPDVKLLKRVIGVAGDTVEIRDDVILINGVAVTRHHADGPCEYDDHDEERERWVKRTCDAWEETLDGRTYGVIFDERHTPRSFRSITIPVGNYFVLGDNRDNSLDSRSFGLMRQEYVLGVARQIWMSVGPEGMRWSRCGAPVR
jgi:signal peptidase I